MISLLFETSKGKQCLTSSDILNRFLSFYHNHPPLIAANKALDSNSVSPNLALNAVTLAVPNISNFPIEEVLETRLKANSELLEFRNELEILQFNLEENYTIDEIQLKAQAFVNYKLNPKLVQLKRKIEALNLKLPVHVLDEFKDPKSYTPILGTLIGAVPIHIAAFLSLGLIGLTSAYEYVLSRKEIRENGLYYLIKLNKKYG